MVSPRKGDSAAVTYGTAAIATTGSSMATKSRSAMVNCRMPHLACRRCIPGGYPEMARPAPLRALKPFVARSWLTGGLGFLNHELPPRARVAACPAPAYPPGRQSLTPIHDQFHH